MQNCHLGLMRLCYATVTEHIEGKQPGSQHEAMTQVGEERAVARAAVIGHFTTFGVGKRPLPEKLKAKERGRLEAAEKALEREMARDRSAFTPV